MQASPLRARSRLRSTFSRRAPALWRRLLHRGTFSTNPRAIDDFLQTSPGPRYGAVTSSYNHGRTLRYLRIYLTGPSPSNTANISSANGGFRPPGWIAFVLLAANRHRSIMRRTARLIWVERCRRKLATVLMRSSVSCAVLKPLLTRAPYGELERRSLPGSA